MDAQPVEPAAEPPAHVEALQPSHTKRRSPLKWLLVILIVAAAAYLLVGSGVLGNNLRLPPFKKKVVVVVTPPSSQSQTAQTSLPAGFSKYKLSGTNITFAAPTAWGTPSSTNQQGYSTRGTTNQPGGTYAYLVDFPSNKDIQIAVTSAKYLPPARGAQYYDFLQWCTGSADNKFYFATLKYSTATDKNQTQTPTTVTCDQGPLTAVTQVDTSTIIQTALKDISGKTVGDVYTKNLSSSDLPVFRVKDAAMTNSVNVKLVLKTVQSTGPAAASPSNTTQ
jgi:hypothetical protein